MDDKPSPSALPPTRLAPPAADPAALRRELERTKRAEAARVAALVQFMLHGKRAAKD